MDIKSSLKLSICYIVNTVKSAITSILKCCFNFLPEQLQKGIADSIQSYSLYRSAYGGYKALLCSPYLFIALIFSTSISLFGDSEWNWSSDAKTIIACTVGFSFAGYSLILGMAGEKFIKQIKGEFPDGKPSPLMVVAASFTHFFVVQCITLFWAIACSAFGALKFFVAKLIGIFLLIYSLFVLLASALAALNFVNWYDKHQEDDED